MARPRGTWTDKHFRDALLLAVKDEHSDGRKKLRVIAEALVEAAAAGDVSAIKEVADRLDGRPAQAVTGEDGGPIELSVSWLSASA